MHVVFHNLLSSRTRILFNKLKINWSLSVWLSVSIFCNHSWCFCWALRLAWKCIKQSFLQHWPCGHLRKCFWTNGEKHKEISGVMLENCKASRNFIHFYFKKRGGLWYLTERNVSASSVSSGSDGSSTAVSEAPTPVGLSSMGLSSQWSWASQSSS